MKFIYCLLGLGLFLGSCSSVTRMTREEINAPVIFAKRGDFIVTEDLTAESNVKVTSFLFVNVIRYNDKKQVRVGPLTFGDREYMEGSFSNYYYPKEFDEQIAIYNFIEEHSDIDYVTNVRFKKNYEQKPYWKRLNIGKREMNCEIIAKGIKLKNKIGVE